MNLDFERFKNLRAAQFKRIIDINQPLNNEILCQELIRERCRILIDCNQFFSSVLSLSKNITEEP